MLHKLSKRECIAYEELKASINKIKVQCSADIENKVLSLKKTVLTSDELDDVADISLNQVLFLPLIYELQKCTTVLERECSEILGFGDAVFEISRNAITIKEFEDRLIQQFVKVHELIDYANINLIAARHLLKRASIELYNVNK